jgi:hypothetical protein
VVGRHHVDITGRQLETVHDEAGDQQSGRAGQQCSMMPVASPAAPQPRLPAVMAPLKTVR